MWFSHFSHFHEYFPFQVTADTDQVQIKNNPGLKRDLIMSESGVKQINLIIYPLVEQLKLIKCKIADNPKNHLQNPKYHQCYIIHNSRTTDPEQTVSCLMCSQSAVTHSFIESVQVEDSSRPHCALAAASVIMLFLISVKRPWRKMLTILTSQTVLNPTDKKLHCWHTVISIIAFVHESIIYSK